MKYNNLTVTYSIEDLETEVTAKSVISRNKNVISAARSNKWLRKFRSN